jgi:chemotaxis signal transduction protein
MSEKIALLMFAGRNFALPVEQIRHIVQEPEVYPLVQLCKGLSGVFLFADEIIPLISGEILSDLGPYKAGKNSYTIVYQSDYGVVGLPVESAVKIVDALDGVTTDASHDDESVVVSQFFEYQEFSYPVLDIEKLLTLLSI